MKFKIKSILIISTITISCFIFTGCSAKNSNVKTPITKTVTTTPSNTELKQIYLIETNKIILDTASSRGRIIKLEDDFQRVIDVPDLISSEIDKTNKNLETLKTMTVYSEYKEPHTYLIKALEYYIEWWNIDLDSANKKSEIRDDEALMKEITILNDKATVNIRKAMDSIPEVNK